MNSFWRAKEAIRDLYNQPDLAAAEQYLADLVDLFTDLGFGPEVNALGGTLAKWGTEIINWCKAKVSNRRLRTLTEAANNLIKRIKRVGFGFRNFGNYRTRVLLYAGKHDWDLLPTSPPPKSEVPICLICLMIKRLDNLLLPVLVYKVVGNAFLSRGLT